MSIVPASEDDGSMSSPLRVGLIGAGYIARVHVHAAAGLGSDLSICAISDTQISAARDLVELQGHGKAYEDVATMLEEERLDGVIIATWPSNHLELIQQCVEAGVRYVLCEKPFVLTGDQAMQVWSLADRAGAHVTEGFMYRHHPVFDRVDRILGERQLGVIDHVRASFTYVNRIVEDYRPDDARRPWRLQAELGGGALYDIGAYAVNACRYVANAAPTQVAAFGRQRNAHGTSDRVHALVEYANGAVGIVQASETAETSQELAIYGQQANLHVPQAWTVYDESELVLSRSIDAVHTEPDRHFRTLTDRLAVPRSNAFVDQLRQAAAVMRGAEQPRVALAETVVNTFTIEAMTTALFHQETVAVTVPPDVLRSLESTAVAIHSLTG